MKLFQEETFGPILAIQTVRDAEEAVARANDSPFALAASVWTGNARRGEAIAGRLRAGAVMVNDAISYFAIAEAPHGGCGASGWGRTHGNVGLLEMVQTKYIDMDRVERRESARKRKFTAANSARPFIAPIPCNSRRATRCATSLSPPQFTRPACRKTNGFTIGTSPRRRRLRPARAFCWMTKRFATACKI